MRFLADKFGVKQICHQTLISLRKVGCQGRTLIETLIGTGVVILLISMVGVGLNQALQSSRTMKCTANLRQIHQAMIMYGDEFQAFPVLEENQTLQQMLKPWIGNSSQVFHCPQEPGLATDSYSYFYASFR